MARAASAAKSAKTTVTESMEGALLKVQEEKVVEPKAQKKKEEEGLLIKSVSEKSVDRIIQDMANVKIEVTRNIDTLSEKLVTSFKQFSDLEKAIEIEKKQLEDIYKIRAEVDSLAALLEAHRIERDQFDAEMEEKKSAWKREEESFIAAKKDREDALKKERNREQEEYEYNLKQTRLKEKDSYEAARAKKEAELLEREKTLKENETLFTEYKNRAEAFDKELGGAVSKAEKQLHEELERSYRHEKELSQKEIDGERKLREQVIASLEVKIKELEKQNADLSKKAADAGGQMQALALKALESAQTRVISQKDESVKG
jgi:hypothetical protein